MREDSKGFYLMRFSYAPQTWSKLLQNAEDRRDAVRAYVEQVGGTLHGFWYGWGVARDLSPYRSR